MCKASLCSRLYGGVLFVRVAVCVVGVSVPYYQCITTELKHLLALPPTFLV